jgi:hypothetical protein
MRKVKVKEGEKQERPRYGDELWISGENLRGMKV